MKNAFTIRRASISLAVGLLASLGGLAPARAQAEVTITVDTTSDVVDFGGAQEVGDLPGPDGQTSLGEAAIATTNTAGPEAIAFDIPTSDPGFTGEEFVIRIDPASDEEELRIGDDATTIDATTQPGGFAITVEGGPQSSDDLENGLHITSSGNTVIGLGIRLYGMGIFVERGSDNLITGVAVTGNRQGIDISGQLVGAGNEVSSSTIADSERSGVLVINTADDTVVADNTIARNGLRGVFVQGADQVTMTGNVISENGFIGIEFQGDSAIAAENTITRNGRAGIVDSGAAGEPLTITRNVIADNEGLGINLLGGREDEFGVTRNNKGGINYPERLEATDDGTATVVTGRIDAAEPQSVTIELFVNDAPDPSGHGEGEEFVGTATADRNGRFTVSLPSGLAGRFVTATATYADGNTSEFSQAIQVSASSNKK